MADLDPGPGFVATLAAEGEIRRLRLYRWDAPAVQSPREA